MTTLIIDNAVIAEAAALMGMTEAQVKTWYAANYNTIKAIRLYIQTRKTTEPEYIEQFAVEGQTLDPALVQQTLQLLEVGGLILTMEV